MIRAAVGEQMMIAMRTTAQPVSVSMAVMCAANARDERFFAATSPLSTERLEKEERKKKVRQGYQQPAYWPYR
jgi:hypothetical protein